MMSNAQDLKTLPGSTAAGLTKVDLVIPGAQTTKGVEEPAISQGTSLIRVHNENPLLFHVNERVTRIPVSPILPGQFLWIQSSSMDGK